MWWGNLQRAECSHGVASSLLDPTEPLSLPGSRCEVSETIPRATNLLPKATSSGISPGRAPR